MISLFSKKSPAKNRFRHVFNLIVALSLVLTALGTSGTTVAMAGKKYEPKADPRLLQMAANFPNNTFKVIVQTNSKNKDSNVEDPQLAVRNGHGRINKQMRLITSFSADLKGKEIIKLAMNKKVRWISLDAPLFSTGTFNSTVVDRFNVIASYTGNDGVYNWSAPWQEIGEADGAGAGVVTVASSPNCASPYNCLRFDGSLSLSYEGYGVSRQVDLSEAPSATFSFSYRRATVIDTVIIDTTDTVINTTDTVINTTDTVINTTDMVINTTDMEGSVSAQISNDGGATWTTLAAYALNADDSDLVMQSFDISAYKAVNTQVRFIGSGTSDRNIYFDDITVSYEAPTNLLKAPTTENILDTFASTDFTGSDGTKNWSTDWIESDVDGSGATIGNIQAFGGNNCWNFTGNCLQVITRNIGDNVSRTVDLSAASSATLTLWRNNQMLSLNNTNAVTLEVSTDGSNWATLRTWRDNNDDIGTASESFDLTPYINSATQIRFSVSEQAFDSYIYFDNIQIQYTTLQNIYPAAVRADKVWNKPPYLDGQGVTVAVVDSGFTDNNDFQVYGGGGSRVVASVDMVSTPPDPTDQYGHGMHVGGILAGNGNFSDGARTGIAPGANLINVKISDSYGMSYASDVVKGLQWVYDNRLTYNIKIVNLSMNSTIAESYQTSPLDAAVEILWNAGIVVVVSSGNSGPGIIFPPANDPFVITVGAADDMGTPNINDDVITSFSVYGTTEDEFTKPDLVAPGRNILSLLASTDARVYTDHPANRVDTYMFRMSGTSMSAPMVSGAVALLLQNEPTLTPDQIKYRLMATANKEWNGYSATTAGAGYLDIYAAIETRTTATANTGIQLSQLLSNGGNPIIWDSVGWESVGWESVGWESVGWESVGWESDNWDQ